MVTIGGRIGRTLRRCRGLKALAGMMTLVDAAAIRARARSAARRLSLKNAERARTISRIEPALRASRQAALASATPGSYSALRK